MDLYEEFFQTGKGKKNLQYAWVDKAWKCLMGLQCMKQGYVVLKIESSKQVQKRGAITRVITYQS